VTIGPHVQLNILGTFVLNSHQKIRAVIVYLSDCHEMSIKSSDVEANATLWWVENYQILKKITQFWVPTLRHSTFLSWMVCRNNSLICQKKLFRKILALPWRSRWSVQTSLGLRTAYAGFLLVQLFDPEDEGGMFLRNITLFQNYMTLKPEYCG
jgi:hypothetical protein